MGITEFDCEVINTFKITYLENGKGFWLSGPNTYSLRNTFRSDFDGQWIKFRGAWFIRMSKLEVVKELLRKQDFKIHLTLNRDESKMYVTGNTYKHRRTIRELGGSWDKPNTRWVFHIDQEDDVRAFINEITFI